MPELPEVETIVNDLKPYLVGRRIKDVKVLNAASVNGVKRFRTRLSGQKLLSLQRYGKNIVLVFNDFAVVIHLKMTGQLVWQSGGISLAGGHPISNQNSAWPHKFTRVIISLAQGTLYFNDVRKFGWIRLMTPTKLQTYLNRLGLEPLSQNYTFPSFCLALGRSRQAIKKVLLDQSKIVGLGNIYVDEALYLAGIKPSRICSDLKPSELQALYRAIPKVLKLSIKNRGTSFSDYRDGQGQVGQNLKFLKVYGRANQTCHKCQSLINKTKLGGRGTHWCPNCQK